MSTLGPLQLQFQDYLLQRSSAILDRIAPGPREDRARLLDIYRNAYLSRLVEVLGNDFPQLRRLAGDNTFTQLAEAYIRARPSRHRSVRWLGDSLPSFLARTQPYEARPAFVEMAAFEWALAAAFDATDAEPATVADLAAVPPEAWGSLRLDLHPSARRLDLRTNVPDLWHEDSIELESVADALVPWLVWRQEMSVKFRSLPEDEAWACDRMMEGASFGLVCEGLRRWIAEDEVPLRAAGLLRTWVESGIVAGIRYDAVLST
jgi:hypothetical protein